MQAWSSHCDDEILVTFFVHSSLAWAKMARAISVSEDCIKLGTKEMTVSTIFYLQFDGVERFSYKTIPQISWLVILSDQAIHAPLEKLPIVFVAGHTAS